MAKVIKLNKKYIPLYNSDSDLIIITGSRGSGKSFVVADYACRDTYTIGEKILYTRYTLTSAKDSIIPEYKEKIELFGAENHFKITQNEIYNKLTGSLIIFKGIKNSSGNQTANLKSIKDPTKWILDEAEEIPDYNTYQKIKRSLRKKGAKIQTILVLNPASKVHWIYKHFFERFNIPDNFNGTENGITYIHTTYLDNLENLDESFLKDANNTKEFDIEEYNHIFLGLWLNSSKDVFFPLEKLFRFKLSNFDKNICIGRNVAIDTKIEGTDYYCAIFGFTSDVKTYIVDVIFNTDSYELNEPLTWQKVNDYSIQNGIIETNAAGRIFFNNLRANCRKTSFIPVFNKVKKITRIQLERQYILENFVFRNDYQVGSDYDLFIKNLTSTLKDGTSKNDDAPDCCAILSTFLRRPQLAIY